ncbi:hypothetical protein VTJ04DRAFT_4546 [Mycothermus thermophilus]|uniref:uncharacterized protein n=1 Tax=Humicola insolens TaxID=85995 RepID=UPI003742AFAF
MATHSITASDAASVTTTSSLSSRISTLKTKISFKRSSSPKKDTMGPASQNKVLRNQIRIGI